MKNQTLIKSCFIKNCFLELSELLTYYLIIIFIVLTYLIVRPKYLIIQNSTDNPVKITLYNDKELLIDTLIYSGMLNAKLHAFQEVSVYNRINSTAQYKESIDFIEFDLWMFVYSGVVINIENVPNSNEINQQLSFSYFHRPYLN